MQEPTPEQRESWELDQIRQRQRRSRFHAKPIGGVMRRLMASTGYGETQAVEQLSQRWEEIVGKPLAALSRPGNVSRGALQVYVANSAVMQELHFRKKQIIAALQATPHTANITDLKIRLGQFAD